MLLDAVSDDAAAIRQLHDNGDREQLMERVHRLHGATRYTGVPELQQAARALETALKRNEPAIDSLVEQLLQAIDRLQYWCDQVDWEGELRETVNAWHPRSE